MKTCRLSLFIAQDPRQTTINKLLVRNTYDTKMSSTCAKFWKFTVENEFTTTYAISSYHH